MAESAFKEWAILELMGHRKLAGMVTEVTLGGAAFIRIDVPGADNACLATQFYSPSAVYCLTPTTEEMARRIAASYVPEPVTKWEIREPKKIGDSSETDAISEREEDYGLDGHER